jgi:quinoprotein glucose dehydrogenase
MKNTTNVLACRRHRCVGALRAQHVAGGAEASTAARHAANGAPTEATWRAPGTRPLDQIGPANFNRLEVAWRFKTDNLGPKPEVQLPVHAAHGRRGVYTTAGTPPRRRGALDAPPASSLWIHREERACAAPTRRGCCSGRGLSYGPTAARPDRLRHARLRMVRLDAKTGVPVPHLSARAAWSTLKLEDDQEMDPVTGDIGLHAAPIIVKDVVIVGAAHTEGSHPVSRRNDKGYVRGYDVRTGKRLWIFHTIPRPASSATTPGSKAPGNTRATPVSGHR